MSAQTPAYAYDKAVWRRSIRRGRERGCWVYIPRDELQAAGIPVEGPPPAYRLSGVQRPTELGGVDRTESEASSMKWYAVTFRGTAEMTVRVLAESPEDARQRAEDGNYVEMDDEDLHFVQGLPYTLKVRVDKP